jgi:hypothetical protein
MASRARRTRQAHAADKLTRANNGIVSRSQGGRLSVRCMPPGHTAHVVLDVNGHFK